MYCIVASKLLLTLTKAFIGIFVTIYGDCITNS